MSLKFVISALLSAISTPPSATGTILLLAAIEDYFVGDPWGWLHPVRVMGWIVRQYTAVTLQFLPSGWQRRGAGILLGILLIVGSGWFGWLAVWLGDLIVPRLGSLVAVVLLASCFAGKSLRVAVLDVLDALNHDLDRGRSRLSLYVGRDTAKLSKSEIFRALLETVAENTVDGVTAPLFYAIVGSFTPIGAVPFALGYKAASTLDSMVGYLREPYTDLGWFSAQLEDRLTWLPCRLTVLSLGCLSGSLFRTWAIARRDGVKDPSPNSGWSEAAYAAILGVQLGGKNIYQGVIKQKPLLGEPLESISVAKIELALNFTRWCFLTWLAIALALHWCFDNSLLVTSLLSSN